MSEVPQGSPKLVETGEVRTKLEDSRLPEKLDVTFLGQPHVIESVDGTKPYLIKIRFVGGGSMLILDADGPSEEVTVSVSDFKNVNIVVNWDGRRVATIIDSQQSGGGSQTIEASGGSTIRGVTQERT